MSLLPLSLSAPSIKSLPWSVLRLSRRQSNALVECVVSPERYGIGQQSTKLQHSIPKVHRHCSRQTISKVVSKLVIPTPTPVPLAWAPKGHPPSLTLCTTTAAEKEEEELFWPYSVIYTPPPFSSAAHYRLSLSPPFPFCRHEKMPRAGERKRGKGRRDFFVVVFPFCPPFLAQEFALHVWERIHAHGFREIFFLPYTTWNAEQSHVVKEHWPRRYQPHTYFMNRIEIEILSFLERKDNLSLRKCLNWHTHQSFMSKKFHPPWTAPKNSKYHFVESRRRRRRKENVPFPFGEKGTKVAYLPIRAKAHIFIPL